jgi:peroxiredoxin
LPPPCDDGAARHLEGMSLPELSLPSTAGGQVAFSQLSARWTVLYCYPMTGVPGQPLPDGWDLLPGARGCTPQACAFRDHHQDLARLGASVYGISTQSTPYQQEVANRLHLPFELLSDAQFQLCGALRLPTFEIAGMRLLKRLTMVVSRNRIQKVFYPVFPPDQSINEVLAWLTVKQVGRNGTAEA